ncbi:glycosyltransferase family 2 protein [Flavobacteriaceae bacterium S0825]|uniref:glycosyltransferase family 2 protein n=1 Tax=Gaetbulibacter sp. S0825 TaxID=2720084 RepID=UPI00142F9C0D|nr:glycosyltransferase family 2 protein [Gaetbulibacter sp. S0825]MCK0107694.1 glycosyltransferase family 2 protein [Flavobacteriaceae bacterium S0825]NIX63330.1 glycosyltransferase family 2 protein [Gaetbulibacter sp. S0825]
MNKTLSIIIPAYNEEHTISEIISRLNDVELIGGIKKEVVIIDDCSTDRTQYFILENIKKHPHLRIQFYKKDKNQGKGSALHLGFEKASGDFIVVQDADLEYDPNEYNLLLKPLLDNLADVVYGSRFIGGNPHRILFFWHSIGNKFLTTISNMFNNLNLTDMETCYKMFRSDIIKNLTLKEERFGFEPEVTAKISKIKGIRIYEIGISYYGRTYEEGKKIGWKDGFRTLYCILKYSF